jgi:hypothetical protein
MEKPKESLKTNGPDPNPWGMDRYFEASYISLQSLPNMHSLIDQRYAILSGFA